MLTVRAHNDSTGPDDAANYNITVDVNGIIVAQGRVTGHDRAQGWRGLLLKIAAMSADAELTATHNAVVGFLHMCGNCGRESVEARPGKFQCQHCE